MTEKTFNNKMSLRERIGGIVYIPIHSVVLPLLLSALYVRILETKGYELNDALLNLIIYAIGALFCFLFMWKYLKNSFGCIFDAPIKYLKTVFSGLCLYYAASVLVTIVILFILPENSSLVNPNTENVEMIVYNNYNISIIMTVFFAPVVEECMFRGALFGSIVNKNRVLAYLVTIIVFSMYHLWGYFVTDYSWELWVYLLQYVPATIILCRAYEKSGTIWCSIAIHALINFIATYTASTL